MILFLKTFIKNETDNLDTSKYLHFFLCEQDNYVLTINSLNKCNILYCTYNVHILQIIL